MNESANAVCRIAVARDRLNWQHGFLRGLERKRAEWDRFTVEEIDIDRSDWLDVIRPFDVIVWKPALMGEGGAAQFRAKVHFMETALNKVVVPNVATSWHFENKAAQSFIFAQHDVPTPRTMIAHDWREAERRLAESRYPIVIKQPHGAASNNVFKVDSLEQARRAMRKRFSRLLWIDLKAQGVSAPLRAWRALREGWLLEVLRSRLNRDSPWQTLYWQEFIPGNASDLRVTVIGDKKVFAFRRGNRPGDFRASGSGRLMYDERAPMHVLRYCLELNRRLNFDSMAYDLLFDADGRFYINEMSYAYNDRAMYDTPGHYEPQSDGSLTYVEGHEWPQDIWGEWAVERARRLWRQKGLDA